VELARRGRSIRYFFFTIVHVVLNVLRRSQRTAVSLIVLDDVYINLTYIYKHPFKPVKSHRI
jgi:hypothetical protein